MSMHLLLKFKNENLIVDGEETTTIREHQKVLQNKQKLIWGQGSRNLTRGIAKKRIEKFKNQIDNCIPTYVFFSTTQRGEKEVYVGRLLNIFERDEIPVESQLIQFIPSYYAGKVGTSESINSVYVEVNDFFKIDTNKMKDAIIENGSKVLEVKNRSPFFYVNLSEEFENYLSIFLRDDNFDLYNEEISFQKNVERLVIPKDELRIQDVARDKPKRIRNGSSISYKRNEKTAKKAIVAAQYQCEVNSTHQFFISRITGKNYVEGHHLIPMEFQSEISTSIDVEANIISLCPLCHKKIHHATYEDIKPIIISLFNQRKERLLSCEIEISIEQLLLYYK